MNVLHHRLLCVLFQPYGDGFAVDLTTTTEGGFGFDYSQTLIDCSREHWTEKRHFYESTSAFKGAVPSEAG